MSATSEHRWLYRRRPSDALSGFVQIAVLIAAMLVAVAATYGGIIIALSGDDELNVEQVHR